MTGVIEPPPPEPALNASVSFPTEPIQLIGGPFLGIRRAPGPLRPIVLIPDSGRDARDWLDVAPRLATAGHEVAAVDLRGHGGSEATDGGYDTDTCADDVANLIELLGFAGGRSPVIAGHGWGANVAMSLAARRDGVAGVACFDGGWVRPAWQYGSVTEYLAASEVDDEVDDAGGRRDQGQPDEAGRPDPAEVSGHRLQDVVRAIRASVYQGEPRAWYPLIRVPVLLAPAVPADGEADPRGRATAARAGVAEAAAGLVRHRITWYTGAGHDLPRTRAARVADDLLQLATAAEPSA